MRKIGDAGVVFETHVLEIELLLRQDKLTKAFSHIEDIIIETKGMESAGTSVSVPSKVLGWEEQLC